MPSHFLSDPSTPYEDRHKNPPIIVSTELTPQFGDVKLAVEWLKNTIGDKQLVRADIRPEKMIPLIRIMSLFDIVRDKNGTLSDLHVRVFSSAMTEIYGEITGLHTSERLPPKIQERFLHHVQAMLDAGKPVFSRTNLAYKGKTYIAVEGLTLPVWRDGVITQCLNFFSFQ